MDPGAGAWDNSSMIGLAFTGMDLETRSVEDPFVCFHRLVPPQWRVLLECSLAKLRVAPRRIMNEAVGHTQGQTVVLVEQTFSCTAS